MDPASHAGIDVEAKPTGAVRSRVACVVLAGGVRASAVSHAAGRSVLDLELTDDATVLEHLYERVSGIAPGGVYLATGGIVPTARVPERLAGRVSVMRDRASCRGPAGVVRDAGDRIPGSGDLLIVESRCLSVGLDLMAAAHAATGAAITVGVNPDGSPAGVYLATRHAVGVVSSVGYVDIKEQWIPRALHGGLAVRAFRMGGAGAMALRTPLQLERARREISGRAPVERGAVAGGSDATVWARAA